MSFKSCQLPDSDQVNVEALSHLFRRTTTSYKYLFFLSILDLLKKRQFKATDYISFQEIIVEMLTNAWYPYAYFQLSFGTTDQITQQLDSLGLDSFRLASKWTQTSFDEKSLRQAIASQNLNKEVTKLARYVPFRLLTPFLDAQLKSAKVDRGYGNDSEQAMPAIADEFFESQKPLYKFDQADYKTCKAILIHLDWAAYLETNYTNVRHWASWEWVTYMEKCNPNTHNIFDKLFIS